MGEILVKLEVLGKEEIDAFVELQLTEIAYSMLGEFDSRCGFSELTEVDAVLSKPLTAAAVLMEAARRTPHADRHLQALLEERRPLEISPNPLTRFQDLSLGSEEGFLLSRIQGDEPPRAIFALSPLSEEDTARTLLGLLLTGIVEFRDANEAGVTNAGQDTSQPRTSEAVGLELASGDVPTGVATRKEIERRFEEFHSQDRWQILELRKGASSEEVKAAFYEKVRRYHPDRYRDIA